MKLLVEKLKRVVEFGGTYAIINLTLSILYFLFFYSLVSDQIFTDSLFAFNIIWILTYILFIFLISKKHLLLSLQTILLSFIFLIIYSLNTSPNTLIYWNCAV